jgi:superfamily I DNA and RNA helicase
MKETWWVSPNELNDEQRAVIALPLEGSHLITGPPGSGKTNLLLLRANYLAMAGYPNILVLVFTRTLQEFIRSGGDQYSFAPSKVKTSIRWEKGFLHSFGVEVGAPQDFEGQRYYLLEEIQKLVEEKNLKNVYDAILLDEAQDYLPGEIQIFRRLGKVLFAVSHSRQKIYNGEDSGSLLRELVDERHELHYHYRIGKQICLVADALRVGGDEAPLSPTCNYDEERRPSSVEHYRCADIDEEAQRIIEALTVQLKAYPEEMFGIICPTRQAINGIWKRISQSPLRSLAVKQISGEHSAFDPSKPICICTLHGAKGLEFRTVHIAECNQLPLFQHEMNIAFTAVTRAKTSLSLYYSKELPGYLEKALAGLEPLPDLPPLESVFGGKK